MVLFIITHLSFSSKCFFQFLAVKKITRKRVTQIKMRAFIRTGQVAGDLNDLVLIQRLKIKRNRSSKLLKNAKMREKMLPSF